MNTAVIYLCIFALKIEDDVWVTALLRDVVNVGTDAPLQIG